jgi:hypothetical protein
MPDTQAAKQHRQEVEAFAEIVRLEKIRVTWFCPDGA